MAGVRWEWGSVTGHELRDARGCGGGGRELCSRQNRFFPQRPHVTRGGRKTNLFPGAEICETSIAQSGTSGAIPKMKHLPSGGLATKRRKGNGFPMWSTECTFFPCAAGFPHS